MRRMAHIVCETLSLVSMHFPCAKKSIPETCIAIHDQSIFAPAGCTVMHFAMAVFSGAAMHSTYKQYRVLY